MTTDSDVNKRIMLINGPNLNLLGSREPEIYGTDTLDEIVDSARSQAEELGLTLQHFQSNSEGEIVDVIAQSRESSGGLIVNAGAFSHYSWAIHDALAAFSGPIIELHLSNPGAREEFRHSSVITPVATAVISGLKARGYLLAVRAIAPLMAS